ncbi:myo-inositol 2-dehydrogenase/D-chiro-inositol 1-dehydrogenase [Luteococcus japonicus]|uniref:Myo-inositol 2-dehydrogenase/D-chiro-inositol 1-dehydrogenase n=1 Tax=Luteococcus japonicus TaxID=33984 RepID=A0A3N1ZV28_9ACTN|nr:Gfo/Idh/MocA family oxidoreductase [Luteococcus japonicus]ROR54646.1 myo-inositol 2-dehydrogenase/D-chiro-inositol 1-dehydrogenase [Luteococcus japonicus]
MRIGIAGAGRIGAYHAKTFKELPGVDEVILSDAFPDVAQRAAEEVGVASSPDVETMLGRIDALVITSPTNTHGELIRAGLAAGLPTFCEKPVAASLEEAIELALLEQQTDVPIQIGFQRRFDVGYRRAREAVESGELGFIHTVRACSLDTAPPPEAYIRVSGGLFRDCNIHDFDIIRYVTGVEVDVAYAVGGNKGTDYIKQAGDIDTGMGIFTMTDGTLVTFSGSRENSYGHDVRMEVHGSRGDIGVGLDESLALISAEEGISWPTGPRVISFMDRFLPAYHVELDAFLAVARGEQPSPCTAYDGVQALRMAAACDLSVSEGRPVKLAEIAGADLTKPGE